MSNASRAHPSAPIVPHAPPILMDRPYTDEQHRLLVDVIRREGPWQLIIAQHFASVEELVATMSGGGVEGARLEDFVTPTFRGYLAKDCTCLYPELEDVFYNHRFLEQARSYWGAKYAMPTLMLFNTNGACDNYDPGHLDGADFRGIGHPTSPYWLMNTMAKSGLFAAYQKKKAQVVTWFYRGDEGGGFTYWPNGIQAAPERLATPIWNKAVVVENERLFHRGEGNGPASRRHPKGLAFNSLFAVDPDSPDGWVITTDGKVVDHIAEEETRLLIHWNADVFLDLDEMRKVLDHRDDLTHDQVFDTFIKDMRARGLTFEVPTDPLHDATFVRLLTETYDVGEPLFYPAEAPGPRELRAAA